MRSGIGDRGRLNVRAAGLRAGLVGALLFGFACGDGLLSSSAEALPGARIRVGNADAWVEIVATPATRNRGLMFREALDEDHGMLFVFPDEQPRNFWMRDTQIPLSIAYADSAGRILRIADMEPFSERSVPSGAPARYALEMQRGWFERKGVRRGDTIRRIPAVEAK